MWRKRVAIAILALVGGIAVLGTAALLLLINLDLRPLLERYAGRALDRRLSIGALHIGWGNPLTVELSDLHLANAPWGRDADMLSLGRAAAEIELMPLLHGVLRYRKLELVKPIIQLERNAEGTGNWHIGGGTGGIAVVPHDRGQFPSLLSFTASGGLLRYRTAAGTDLRIEFGRMAIESGGDDQPVSLRMSGAYNHIPVELDAATQSFVTMRNTAVPFGADFTLVADGSKFTFSGSMTDPLDFDGVTGTAHIEATDLGKFAKLFGAEMHAAIPLRLAGALTRRGDDWQLTEAAGTLGADAVAGKLALHEGTRRSADNLTLGVDFPRLDLRRVFAALRQPDAAKPADDASLSLQLEQGKDLTVDGRIGAHDVAYDQLHFTDAVLQGRSAAGEITVQQLAFGFAGGRVTAAGSAHAVSQASHVVAELDLSRAEVGQLARLLGSTTDDIAGRLDGGIRLAMTGATLHAALTASRGQAVLAMTGGRVSRDLLERASTDLRALFRAETGSTTLTCLLAVVDLNGGIGAIAPFRLRTAGTSLFGAGQVDLGRESLELVIKGEKGGGLALNLPLRINGGFADLHVGLARNAPAVPETSAAMPSLPPDLQLLAERSACLP